MKKLILIIIFLGGWSHIYGQILKEVFDIKGTITYLGSPLKDVKVQVKESTTTTSSDKNGDYVLKASIGDVLEYTYPGLNKKLYIIEDSRALLLNIEMENNIVLLDEVVLTSKRTDNVESINTALGIVNVSKNQVITSDEISPAALTFLDVLRGKFSGVQIKGPAYNPTVLVRGGIPTQGGKTRPAIFDIDGVITDVPPIHIDPINIEKITVLKGMTNTIIYGSQGVGGVIVINSKARSIKYEPGTNKIYDQARVRNNVFEGNAISHSNIKSLEPSYLNEIELCNTIDEALKIYEKHKIIYGDNPYYYLSVATKIKSKFNDQKAFIAIISVIEENFSKHTPALKALAYTYDELGLYDSSSKIYQKIIKNKPSNLQSYRNYAQSNINNGNDEQALRMYYRLLKNKNDTINKDFNKLVENEINNLMRHLDVNTSEVLEGENIDKKDVRIIFEWNNYNSEFELQFVNPDGLFYKWEHTWNSKTDLITQEIEHGYAIKEFYIDELSYADKWLINIKYIGNKSFDPTYMKVTTTYDYGKHTEKSKINIFRLSVKNVNQQLLDLSRVSLN